MTSKQTIAVGLVSMRSRQMQEFAELIRQWATDDNGAPNDASYIARCLLDWADEQNPEHPAT